VQQAETHVAELDYNPTVDANACLPTD